MKVLENIYIHLPFCLKKCHYCSFPIHAIGINANNTDNNEHFLNMQQRYIDAILKEIKLTSSILSKDSWVFNPLQSIYFGGGTPSLFQSKFIASIMNGIHQYGFKINKNTEITMECDPGTFSQDKIKEYEQLDINRISLGIQSFDDITLKKLNRSQDIQANYQAIQILQQSQRFKSLDNVSFDLIMNLPENEQDDTWKRTLDIALRYSPGHISAYSLQIDPKSYFYEKLNLREGVYPLPSNNKAADTFIQTHNILSEDYNHYEVSSFIRKNLKTPIHNPIYWEGNKSFLAFGMGASSLVGEKRFTRPSNLAKYYSFVELLEKDPNNFLNLGEDESHIQTKIESILMGKLRTKQGVDLQKIQKYLTSDEMDKFKKIIEIMAKQNNQFNFSQNNFISLQQPDGYLFCDDIVADLSVSLERILKKTVQR